jgi:hypothetical protein
MRSSSLLCVQVKIWFQNRRTKWKKLEGSGSSSSTNPTTSSSDNTDVAIPSSAASIAMSPSSSTSCNATSIPPSMSPATNNPTPQHNVNVASSSTQPSPSSSSMSSASLSPNPQTVKSAGYRLTSESEEQRPLSTDLSDRPSRDPSGALPSLSHPDRTGSGQYDERYEPPGIRRSSSSSSSLSGHPYSPPAMFPRRPTAGTLKTLTTSTSLVRVASGENSDRYDEQDMPDDGDDDDSRCQSPQQEAAVDLSVGESEICTVYCGRRDVIARSVDCSENSRHSASGV